MTRKKISETLYTEYNGWDNRPRKSNEEMDWDGYSLDDIVTQVDRIRKEYGDKYTNIRLDRQYGYNNDDHDVWSFMGTREETDEEINTRIAYENEKKKNIADKERAEFERLSKIFNTRTPE